MRHQRTGPDSGWQHLWRGFIVLGLTVASCVSTPRAPASSCMQRTIDSLERGDLPDSRLHCLASGTIVLRCGRVTAWTAGYGKEIADLFGPGTFQRKDLQANAAGRTCAGRVTDEQDLGPCCAEAIGVKEIRTERQTATALKRPANLMGSLLRLE